jgi:serine/threonine-protein kinase RsbW/stage II sporulation protein AB (anti-sigma F factor)
VPIEFSATYEATPQNVAVLRNQMATLARDCGLDDLAIHDVKLAVSEAATNALLHAYRDTEPGTIRVEAVIENGDLVIAIKDDGVGMAPRTDSPGLGLGLPVIASVAKRVEVIPDEPGTRLRMAFTCPRAAAPEPSVA